MFKSVSGISREQYRHVVRGFDGLNWVYARCRERDIQVVDIQVRLLSEKKIQRHQRKTYKKQHKMYDNLWTAYVDGDKTAKQLLYACARINGPRTDDT